MLRISGNSFGWLLVVFLTTMFCGCSLRHSRTPTRCAPYISQRHDFQAVPKPVGAGVQSDFDSIGDYRTVRRSLIEPLTPENALSVDLNEVLCAAARNSALADLIEAERHALACRVDDCNPLALDLLLQGEALEQRNKSAGAAGGLFLRLVEIELQRELLSESAAHLDQLSDTIQGAAAQGFSTTDGEHELAVGRTRLQAMESKLNTASQRLSCELSGLIGLEGQALLRPVYDLKPSDLDLDMQQEIQIAESSRPGILAIESALSIGINPEAVLEFLGLSDSRLGLQKRIQPVGKRTLIRKVIEKSSLEPDTSNTRRDQLARLLEGRKGQARNAAEVAVIKIQGSLEKLAIANENVARMRTRAEQLSSKVEIDVQGVYLELNRNWFDLQTAKSERVSAAVEYDSAVIELLQAQGALSEECGFCLKNVVN